MRSSRVWPVLTTFISAALIGLAAINYNFACQDLGGNDFVPRWAGARLFP